MQWHEHVTYGQLSSPVNKHLHLFTLKRWKPMPRLAYALLLAGFMTVPFLLSMTRFPHLFSLFSESLTESI